MRGRKPKPTKLRIAEGNREHRPLPANEPQPSTAVPPCPGWLDAVAKEKWAILAPELARIGVLTSVDGDVLACYCQAWAEFTEATRGLQSEGRRIKGANGAVKPNPAVGQQRSAWKAIQQFAALFGLDPSSRSRLNLGGAPDPEDEFETFLGGKPG